MIQNEVLLRGEAAIETEAALCSLLSELFLRNPDAALVKTFREIDPASLALPEGAAEAISRMKTYAEAAGETEDDLGFLNLKRDWTKLFRAVSPGYGPTAPYGILFLKGVTQETMAELAALYLDGGYDGFQKLQNRIDYIGTEFQYVATVDLQLLDALSHGAKEEAGRLELCRARFLAEFFSPWVKRYAQEAARFAQTDFYAGALELARIAADACFAKKETHSA